MADFMQANGGFLSYEDLATHHGDWVEPVSTNYRGYDVWELPPNGQGIAALQILNIWKDTTWPPLASAASSTCTISLRRRNWRLKTARSSTPIPISTMCP